MLIQVFALGQKWHLTRERSRILYPGQVQSLGSISANTGE